ncbi:MAG: BatA domain-containing protein [Desulfococcaceae bacterium]
MFSFLWTYALWGLIAVPILAAIWLLNRRQRFYTVSSLMLWEHLRPLTQSGLRLNRLMTQFLFFLELLIILLFVSAAAGPAILSSDRFRPLTVVLDDSVSMRASDGQESFREKGIKQMEKSLRSRPFRPVRFILAGTEPKILSGVSGISEIQEKWKCYSPAARMDAALGAAGEISGEDGLILVISDHGPSGNLDSRIVWKAAGMPFSNAGFVSGVRSSAGDKDRILLETGNFSDQPMEQLLKIDGKDQQVRMEARGRKRMIFESPENADKPLIFQLPDDALAEDSRIILFPRPVKKAGVDVRIVNPGLHALVKRAVQASGLAFANTPAIPDIIFTDSRETGETNGRTWTVQMISEKEALPYSGPFVSDNSHPLMKGISLEGIIWASGRKAELPGVPVISIGDIPVLSDLRKPSGIHEIRLRMDGNQSTLPITPAWPGLIWNLIHWRISELPGLGESNVRAGTPLFFVPENKSARVRMILPDLTEHDVPVTDGKAYIQADQPGIYKIKSGDSESLFAVNFFSPEESDLSGCVSGQWGNWNDSESLRSDSLPLAWIFLLLALAGLAVHLMITSIPRPLRHSI